MVELAAGGVVVVGPWVVLVVTGAVGSIDLVVVSVELVVVSVVRVAEVVVVVTRSPVGTVLDDWTVTTEGVDVVVPSGAAVVLVLVVEVPGRVVVVTATPLERGTCRDGRPRPTSRRRAPRETRANPYSTTFMRYAVDRPAHRVRT